MTAVEKRFKRDLEKLLDDMKRYDDILGYHIVYGKRTILTVRVSLDRSSAPILAELCANWEYLGAMTKRANLEYYQLGELNELYFMRGE